MVSLKSVRKYLASIAFGYQNALWGEPQTPVNERRMKKMGMIGVFVGAMVGGCFGVVVTCLAVAAKRADEQDGIYEPGDKRARDTALPKTDGRTIRFTDPEGVLLFTIPDGDCVTLMYGDGETVAGVCRYLDQDHAEINGVRWRMTEFALQMQIRGILFSPAITK